MDLEGHYEKSDRTYTALTRGLGSVENLFASIGGLVIFALMWFGAAQVISRWIFRWPIRGYVDIVELSVALFAFLGLAYCQRVGGHIRMDLLLRRLRLRPLWALEALGVALGLFVIGSLVLSTYSDFLRSWSLGGSTMDLRLPTWPSQLAVTIALGLLWLRLAMQFWACLILMFDPERRVRDLPGAGGTLGE